MKEVEIMIFGSIFRLFMIKYGLSELRKITPTFNQFVSHFYRNDQDH